MAFVHTWNATFETLPTDAEDLSDGASRIRNLKAAISERAEIDHNWDGGADDGTHKKVTFQTPLGAKPTLTGTQGAAYTKTVAGVTELFYEDQNGNEVQLTENGSLKSAATIVGEIRMWPYTTIPSLWLPCDGSLKNNTTYELLLDKAISDIGAYGRGTPITFTVDTANDEIDDVGHGLSVDDIIYVTSAGSLPGGLAADTKYYVVAVPTADSFQISATKGGGAIDITSVGSGTHSYYKDFAVPDFRGKSPLGVNDSGLPNGEDGSFSTRNEGDTGGEETHQLTIAEMPSHTHSQGSTTTGGQATSGTNNKPGGSTGSTGGNGAHNTMHPFLAVHFIIFAGV